MTTLPNKLGDNVAKIRQYVDGIYKNYLFHSKINFNLILSSEMTKFIFNRARHMAFSSVTHGRGLTFSGVGSSR